MVPLTESLWPQLLRSGQRLFLGGGAACPHGLMGQLVRQATAFHDLELLHASILGPNPWTEEIHRAHLRVHLLGGDPRLRHLLLEGAAEWTNHPPSRVAELFQDGLLPLDAALVMVTPPDAFGRYSLGVGVDFAWAACGAARLVIAQINPRLPRTNGQTHLPASRLSHVLEYAAELPEARSEAPGPLEEKIAAQAALWVEDGATLRPPPGPLGEAWLAALRERTHLGVHSDHLSDGLRLLFETGAVDNARKTSLSGRMAVCTARGSTGLYDFCDRNPHVEFHPAEVVCHPAQIAAQHRMTCAGLAQRVDLTGWVVPDPLDPAFGDFRRGAALAAQGFSVALLPSTTPDGKVSRLTLEPLEEPAGTLTVDAVATEYGTALLRGRSLSRRVAALVEIAHPDFREPLLAKARELKLLPPNWRLSPPYDPARGRFRDHRLPLKDGVYLIRLLNAADAPVLQEFFYSHSEETIHRRYGFQLKRMSRERALELVAVDQHRELALGIFQTDGPRQVLHAVGRYYLDKDGKGAEMAFVTRETKRRVGMARALLQAMIDTGRARGLAHLWAQVDRDNGPMLKLFQLFGAHGRPGEDFQTIKVHLGLTGESEPPAPAYSVLRAPPERPSR